MNGNEYILQVQNVSKRFPGVLALNNVSFNVRKGTVHALMGENGAGKSTMMKVLLGIHKRDSGVIKFRGEPIQFKNPSQALNSGIAMIHQELSTVQDLTVWENIFLGKEITYGKSILCKKKEMIRQTEDLLKSLEVNIDPNAKIRTLSVAQQQMCEIAKAISYNAELIIMDEPTSAITESEVNHLFKIIKNLVKEGITIIYITHKMDEVFTITDEITVLRDGTYIDTLLTKDTSNDELIKLMVGREITDMYPDRNVEIGNVYLKVENLTREGEFEDISFEVRRGEILGVAGLMGSGRSEAMETLFGIRKKTSGKIYINGKETVINNPRDAIANGLALLTEDRKYSGCFLPLSVCVNIVISSLRKFCNYFFIDRKKMYEVADSIKEKMNVRTPSLEQKMINLSGGNQQKVLVGRWLLNEPEILIVDEPTRGIDVGAKAEIYKLLSNLAEQGKCIIMISSELPEILGMSDRVMVMCEGRMTGIIEKQNLCQERIMRYATGITA